MTRNPRTSLIARLALLCLLGAQATMLAGCTQDIETTNDVHVPIASGQRFPITVAKEPVSLRLSARTGKLASQDADRLADYARAAQAGGAGPVSVSYPSGSRKAAGVSQQAVSILRSNGVPSHMIRRTSYAGKSDIVSLSFTRIAATTAKCGDFSKNLGNNPLNEPPPDFGCSYQNNFAAMVEDPEDFLRPRVMRPAPADGRMTAIRGYQSGRK